MPFSLQTYILERGIYGRKEEPMIAYYNDPGHFADLMNGWIYRGEKKLTAEQMYWTSAIHQMND